MLDRLLKYFRKDKPADSLTIHNPAINVADVVVSAPESVRLSRKHPAMTAPIVRKAEPAWETTTITTPVLPPIPRGWKRADGKTRHVTKGYCDVMLECGAIHRNCKASDWTVSWYDGYIIAYRVRKPVKNQKVFSGKPKNPNSRKTVTVKKRSK